jgi:glutathione-specific gamma-glutamylcyclotransferase
MTTCGPDCHHQADEEFPVRTFISALAAFILSLTAFAPNLRHVCIPSSRAARLWTTRARHASHGRRRAIRFGATWMLNRNVISSGAYLERFESLPKEMLWSQTQIEQSLADTMAKRPASGDVWVFAYGSLMWNPISKYDQRVSATLPGWHRSFCLRLIAGRATPEQPGRMLALESGGSTEGVALRIPADTLDEELRILWIREMVTGAYNPIWAPLTFTSGQEGMALAFVANPARPQYEADARPATIAPLMSVASGWVGSNVEYVFELQRALADCGIEDGYIDELAAELLRLGHAV